MKKVIFRAWDINDIPWYMFDEDMYTIEEIRYEDDFDLVLAGSVEYLVYLNANEDGDWVDGSDYSYNECMTATEEATVLSALGIKEFLFPDDEYCDAFFGGQTPCCVDEDEVRRLADEWDMPFDELMSQMHTASADEIREYRV